MNRALWIIGGVAWFALVFWVTLYLSFPSEGVGRFVASVVSQRTNGQYRIEMDGAKPWWVGLAGDNVIVYSTAGGTDDPVFFADALGVRIHPLALLRKGRQFSGYATMEDSTIEAQVSATDDDGNLTLRRLQVVAQDLAIETLTGLLGKSEASPIDATGSLDVDIDLNMKEGIEKAEGKISILGDGVRLAKVAAPAIGLKPMELDMPVTELDIEIAGDGGLLKIERGVVRSQAVNIDLHGEVTTGDRLDRSRVHVEAEVEIGDWAGLAIESFRAMVDTFTASKKCEDGRLHYVANTTVSRFSFNDFREEKCKGSATRPTRTGATGAAADAGAVAPPPLPGATPPPPTQLPATPGKQPARPVDEEPPPMPEEPAVEEPAAPEGEEPPAEEPPPQE